MRLLQKIMGLLSIMEVGSQGFQVDQETPQAEKYVLN